MQRHRAALAACSLLLCASSRVAVGVRLGSARRAGHKGSLETSTEASPEPAPQPAFAPGPAADACEPWCERVQLPHRCSLEGVCTGCGACAGSPIPQPALAPAPAPAPGPALVRVWEPFERSSCTFAHNTDPFWRGWLHNPTGTVAGCKRLCETKTDAFNRPCVAIEIYANSTNDAAKTLHCNLAWGCSALKPWNGGMVLKKSLGPLPPPLASAPAAAKMEDAFASSGLSGSLKVNVSVTASITSSISGSSEIEAEGSQELEKMPENSVMVDIIMEGLDYGLLSAAGQQDSVTDAVKAGLSEVLELSEKDVAVELSAGSVVARATVHPLPANDEPNLLAHELSDSSDLCKTVGTSVLDVSGIEDSLTDVLGVGVHRVYGKSPSGSTMSSGQAVWSAGGAPAPAAAPAAPAVAPAATED